jgi:hypothetical protein
LPGDRFLGACIVYGNDIEEAVENAWMLRCNPGGEALAVEMPPNVQALVPDDLFLKLLDRATCDQLEALFAQVRPNRGAS